MRLLPARRLVAVTTCTVLALLLCDRATAAQANGSVSGVVKDVDGNPVAGLALRLEQPTTPDKSNRERGVKVVARAVTDEEGKYRFDNVPPGEYILVGGSRKIGWIYYPIEVVAAQETKLGETVMVKG